MSGVLILDLIGILAFGTAYFMRKPICVWTVALMTLGFTTLILVIVYSTTERARAQDVCVDTAIVLLADVSLSMDDDELRLQRDAYVDAFTRESVLQRIHAGACGRIAVRLGEFADVLVPVTDWWVIGTADDASDFASAIRRAPKSQAGGKTGTGTAMAEARKWLDQVEAVKYVVDVSADGVANTGLPIESAHVILNPVGVPTFEQVQVNGLPLLMNSAEPRDLLEEFDKVIVSGPGAFLEPVHSLKDLADSIERKLIREMV